MTVFTKCKERMFGDTDHFLLSLSLSLLSFSLPLPGVDVSSL